MHQCHFGDLDNTATYMTKVHLHSYIRKEWVTLGIKKDMGKKQQSS